MIGISLAMGFAAVNTGNNMLYLIDGMLLATMAVAAFFALFNVRHLQLQWIPGQVLTVGQIHSVQIQVHNPGRVSAWMIAVRAQANPSTRFLIPRIPARGLALATVSFRPLTRGPLRVEDLRVGSAFPFDFAWRGHRLDTLNGEAPWVAPAPSQPAWHPRAPTQDPSDVRLSRNMGGMIGDFHGIREQIPGESQAGVVWRRVDWARLAFTGNARLPVREWETPLDETLILSLDDPDLQELPIESRLEHLRSALDVAIRERCTWQLKISGQGCVGQGGSGALRALRSLAEQRPFPEPRPIPPAPQRKSGWWAFIRARAATHQTTQPGDG